MKHRFITVFGTVTLCLAMLTTLATAEHHAPRMTKETLRALQDDPDAKVTIIDVRSKGQWEKSTFKVKGAVWENPVEFASWADFKYSRTQPLVLYCA